MFLGLTWKINFDSFIIFQIPRIYFSIFKCYSYLRCIYNKKNLYKLSFGKDLAQIYVSFELHLKTEWKKQLLIS